jgi:hypothetical protein
VAAAAEAMILVLAVLTKLAVAGVGKQVCMKEERGTKCVLNHPLSPTLSGLFFFPPLTTRKPATRTVVRTPMTQSADGKTSSAHHSQLSTTVHHHRRHFWFGRAKKSTS